MPRRPRVKLVSCALAVASLTAGCGRSSDHAAPTTTSPGASASFDYCRGTTPRSQVVVYSVKGLDYWYNDVLTAFQQNCGVRVVFQSDTSSAIEQQLLVDKSSPYADIVIAEAPDLVKADSEGLLATEAVPGSSAVPADRCGRARHWCDVIENFASFVYNPTLVKRPPATLQDLLAPEFAGNLLVSDLAAGEDGRTLLDLLDVTLGRAAALRFITQLEPSVKTHWISTDTMSKLVAAGQARVANGNLREQLNDIAQYNFLNVWFPQVGVGTTTIAMPYGAALVRGGHNHTNAVALLKFMWSTSGQMAVGDAPGLPARTDVMPSDCRSVDLRQRLAGVRIVRPDWEQVARDEQYLASAWLHLRRAPHGIPPAPVGIPPLQPC